MFSQIYSNLCESNKSRKDDYKKYSGLHEHHITPKHMGGTDENHNLTYLNVREHIIAHYLLWKIYGNINDLRSMNMLGINLSPRYRILIGKWCYENKIGFFSDKFNKFEKFNWRKKGIEKQIEQKIGIHNPNKFKEYASIGGKASIKSPNNPWSYWASKEGLKKRSSLGGKSHKGKKTMYKPGDSTFIRVKCEDFDAYIKKGYVFGSPISNPMKGKKTNKISPRRKKVTDGLIVYNSVQEAAEKNNLTPSAIIHRCKSKKSTWQYAS